MESMNRAHHQNQEILKDIKEYNFNVANYLEYLYPTV